jgi:hypothetical protein
LALLADCVSVCSTTDLGTDRCKIVQFVERRYTNSRLCTELHNGWIYSLNGSALKTLFGTDIAYGMFKILIHN